MRVSRNALTVDRAGRDTIGRALARGYAATDDFRELKCVKRDGHRDAAALGHKLSRWHKRPYSPLTAATAYCAVCNRPALIDLNLHGARAVGKALTERCEG